MKTMYPKKDIRQYEVMNKYNYHGKYGTFAKYRTR